MRIKFMCGEKKVSAKIDTGNDAFYNGVNYDPDAEIDLIRMKIHGKINSGEVDGKCMDSNGNTVGSWRIIKG